MHAIDRGNRQSRVAVDFHEASDLADFQAAKQNPFNPTIQFGFWRRTTM
jgi:hypothetical protein